MRDLTDRQEQALDRIATTVKVVGWVAGVGPVLRLKHGKLAVLTPLANTAPIVEVPA